MYHCYIVSNFLRALKQNPWTLGETFAIVFLKINGFAFFVIEETVKRESGLDRLSNHYGFSCPYSI